MAFGRHLRSIPFLALGAVCLVAAAAPTASHATSRFYGGYSEVTVDNAGRTVTIVFHALDRDGFCDAAAFGAVSLHPVLTDAPGDTSINPATALPNPRETVDFLVDAGDGIITGVSGGAVAPGGRSAFSVPTYSTYANARTASPVRSFTPLVDGVPDECQAWVTVTGAPGATLNLLVIVHDDLGDIGFDRVIQFSSGAALNLTYRWTLVTWPGPDGISPRDGLSGRGAATGGNNILDRVTAVYGWNPATGGWEAFFPSAAAPPGSNDLAALRRGQAYWVAIAGPGPLLWRVAGAQ